MAYPEVLDSNNCFMLHCLFQIFAVAMTTCSHLNLNRLKFRVYFLSDTSHF